MPEKSYHNIHMIAIGGSAMHNLALALQKNGFNITGSDDKIYEPSRTRLAEAGILPETEGWDPSRISEDTDLVILGMHAKEGNPELEKARELGIKIMSMPEYVYEASKNKQRIVIGGSHGKTTITSMVMHVLQHVKKEFDYFVGAQVPDFDIMVRLSDAAVIVIEGDEYLSSAVDPVSKFLRYHHHIGVISGIAWDHANVFPEFENYLKQFEDFADQTPKAGTLIYNREDDHTKTIGEKNRDDVASIAYGTHPHRIRDGKAFLVTDFGEIEVQFFGAHNMSNLCAAKEICKQLCIVDLDFYEAIRSFRPAQRRLELLAENDTQSFYRDFAHAPSKVKASVSALKSLRPERNLLAILELHTFSSLQESFVKEYRNSLDPADIAVVFLDKEVVELKGNKAFSEQEIRVAFANSNIRVFYNADDLNRFLIEQEKENTDVVFMSSGNFGNLDINSWISKLAI
ncbi:peptidoglycan synthetase [Fulvitalea axinellae]|uniref:Peptidoglycan synthetase n=1 Tax=Fulvitalea axinellae TaxID=1182444 RepID=A0AAU9CT01_9BACT|nr:peptidoglycan synthetase [Fulvitalea axinellae]